MRRYGAVALHSPAFRLATPLMSPLLPASPASNLASLLLRTARSWPRLPAVALGARVIHGYATLAERAARLAGALTARGLAPGDRVALVSHNVPEYIETMFACWWAGLTVVP